MKDIKGYEGKYYADTLGNIYRKTKKELRKLKYSFTGTNKDYNIVCLCSNNVKKRYLVHRIIAETFIPNNENKEQVNHIDGNKFNNCVSNLEWVTRSENQKHAIKLGLRTTNGVKNSQCKLTEKSVLDIRDEFKSIKNKKILAEKYQISLGTIYDIIQRRSWKHI